jgi:hypothetical protein
MQNLIPQTATKFKVSAKEFYDLNSLVRFGILSVVQKTLKFEMERITTYENFSTM